MTTIVDSTVELVLRFVNDADFTSLVDKGTAAAAQLLRDAADRRAARSALAAADGTNGSAANGTAANGTAANTRVIDIIEGVVRGVNDLFAALGSNSSSPAVWRHSMAERAKPRLRQAPRGVELRPREA